MRIKNLFHTYSGTIIDVLFFGMYGALCLLLGKYYFQWLWVWWPVCFTVFVYSRLFKRSNKILKNPWVIGIGAVIYTLVMMAVVRFGMYLWDTYQAVGIGS